MFWHVFFCQSPRPASPIFCQSTTTNAPWPSFADLVDYRIGGFLGYHFSYPNGVAKWSRDLTHSPSATETVGFWWCLRCLRLPDADKRWQIIRVGRRMRCAEVPASCHGCHRCIQLHSHVTKRDGNSSKCCTCNLHTCCMLIDVYTFCFWRGSAEIQYDVLSASFS